MYIYSIFIFMDEITRSARQGKRVAPRVEDNRKKETKHPVDRYYAESFLDRYFKKLKIER
jgi:hypothetical protein